VRWTNVPAGRYIVALRPTTQPSVAVVSVRLNGLDIEDEVLDVQTSAIENLEVKLTGRAPMLSGAVRTAAGTRGSSWVVVFPINERHWHAQCARVSGVFAGAGEYTFSRLPPGEYWVATVPDLQPRQWFDPRFLESLRAGAERITLRDGDTPRLDLRAR
jgi:hypothetical protein